MRSQFEQVDDEYSERYLTEEGVDKGNQEEDI